MIIGISGYVGNKLTGIGRVLVNVLNELAKQNPNDTYVLFKNFNFKDYTSLKSHSNIEIVDIPVTKESGLKNIIWHQWGFQKCLREYKCDIAYIPNFSLLLWKQVPTVVTIHDLIEYNVPDKFGKLRIMYRKFADPLLAHRSDFILTVSQSSKNDIIKFLNVRENKILVTPNASNKLFFKRYEQTTVESVVQKHNLAYKDYLLFVGTIDYPGKNIKTVLEAYFNLRAANKTKQKLVIIGKAGFNAQIIYDYVNSSPYKDDVVFTGYLVDEDLPKYYAGASIMLYLSLCEGFGLPVLEAMSCSTAVICSNTSCFPEIVEELDVCCPPTDVTKVEERIISLLSNDSYRKDIEEKCFQKAQKYDWHSSAVLYAKAFHNLRK